MKQDLSFVHRYVPAGADAPTLLLLHGTGGDENDLLPIGERIAPGWNLLSPRGRVSENGMPRFFRRHAMGVLDVEDLKARAHELADFVGAAAQQYGFDEARVVAFGYSNGANIASGVLLERPGTLAGASLARAMVPYEPEGERSLGGARIQILAGRADPYSQGPVSDRLARIFSDAGAKVDLHWSPAGHELTPGDLEAARAWLAEARP